MPHHVLPDGVPLWFEARGTGRPLVLLQGLQFPAAYFWSRNIDVLAEHHRVIIVDLRGQGLSGKPSHGHSVAQNATDLEHFLAANAPGDVFLLGVAFGGLVALSYLEQFGSGRLRALGLCEMTPCLVSEEGWAHPTFGDFPPQAAAAYGDTVRADRGVLAGFLAAAFAEPLDPAMVADMQSQLWLTPTETVATLIDDMVKLDFRAMLPSITVPTLLIYGRANNPVMPGAVGRWMRDRLPDAELAELPGGGHSVFWEDPVGFNAAIDAFAERRA